MLAKSLQIIGLLLTSAGVVGDERLTQWETRIRAGIGRATNLTWARKILALAGDWSTRLYDAIFHNEKLILAFVIVVIAIVGIAATLINSYAEGQRQLMLYEAQKQDPVGYDRQMLYFIAFLLVLLGILLLVDKIGAFLEKNAYFLLRLLATIGRIFRWLGKAYMYVTFSVVFGVVAIVLLSPLLLLLVGGFIIVIIVVSVMTVGYLFIRLALLPYEILDRLVVQLKFKSTLFIIGVIVGVIGIIIQ
jgi:hypothetical protein